jgi:hypothetical protein
LIWRDEGRARRRHLDGQAFGVPAQRADGTPSTALAFPTGGGSRASDFESWCYVGARRPATPLLVKAVTWVRANGEPSSAGTVGAPLPAGAVVRFKVTEQVRFIDIAFNQPIAPVDQPEPRRPQSVFVELVPGAAAGRRVLGTVSRRDDTTVRFEARDPEIFVASTYTLTVLGDGHADIPPIVAAAGSPRLDGDFDGNEGGNFSVTFVSV